MATPDGRAISVSIGAITRHDLYLDPTETDVLSGIRDFHPNLFLDVNTEVTIVEFHRHAVKYVKGDRYGFAGLTAFGLHHSVDLNVILPQAFDEQYGSGEVRRHPSPPGLTRDPNQVPRMIYDYDSAQNQIPDVESDAADIRQGTEGTSEAGVDEAASRDSVVTVVTPRLPTTRSPHVRFESRTSSDQDSRVPPREPIEQPRTDGDDLNGLNATMQNLSVHERPTAESTPMPNLIHRPRGGSKRPNADSTMLEQNQVISSNDIATLQAQIDQLGVRLTHLAATQNTNINANTNHMVNGRFDQLSQKFDNQVQVLSNQINHLDRKVDTHAQTNLHHLEEVKQYFYEQNNLAREESKSNHKTLINMFERFIQESQSTSSTVPVRHASANVPTTVFSKPVDEPMDDGDSSSDSESEPDHQLNNFTHLPVSVNISSLSAELDTTEDKGTSDALKAIRNKPEKVPTWNANRSKMCMALFMCKTLYKFAKRQGLHKVAFLDRWIDYAFPESEDRVLLYLHSIQEIYPRAGLFMTLRELARKMSPDDFVSLEVLGQRHAGETMTDFAIRLMSDIPICQDVLQDEIPKMALRYIRSHEKNTDVAKDLRRELLKTGTKLNKTELFEVMEIVDRLNPQHRMSTSNRFAPLDEQVESQETLREQHQAVITAIHGLANQMNVKNSQNTQVISCKDCGKSHNRYRPDGKPWPYCETCFKKVIALRSPQKPAFQQKTQFFAQPTVTAAVCENCKAPVKSNRNGVPFRKCQTCYLKSVNRAGKVGDIKHFSQIRLDDITNNVIRTQAEAIGAQSIYEITDDRFDEKRYRMSVKVTNMYKNNPITGLLDTGCNTEALSESACNRLGIKHLINRNVRSTARGVDDRDLGVIGEVKATLFIGDVPYTSSFQVLKDISGYDMMIGTRFMLSNNLMETIYGAAQKTLGKENVFRGN